MLQDKVVVVLIVAVMQGWIVLQALAVILYIVNQEVPFSKIGQ